jgi:four helix bundle protein
MATSCLRAKEVAMQAPHHMPLQTLSRVRSSPVFPFQRLDAYVVARELVRLVHSASLADAELRDQATRAAKSAFLNLCEGLPDDRPAVRRRYFRQADGSVHEVAGALDLAAVIRALDEGVAQEGMALAARLRALLRGLMR